MAVDQRVKQMMEELGKALAQAIRTSSDVSEAIRKIRHRGMSPHLILSCERGVEDRLEDRGNGMPVHGGADALPSGAAEEPSPGESEFRLNGRDVALLKSMGIDPTRRGRTPRRRRRASRQRQGSAERRRS